MYADMPGFSQGDEDPNLGPHAFSASSLPIEPSPDLRIFLIQILLTLDYKTRNNDRKQTWPAQNCWAW